MNGGACQKRKTAPVVDDRLCDTGFRLADFKVDALERHPQNPKIVVRCIAESDGRLLLCQRADEPRRGFWSTPGGFLANGEALPAAAIRETWEEAGAEIANLRLACVHELPQLEEIVMIFRAQVLNERVAAGAESLEARLFEPARVPWNAMAFPTDCVALQRHIQRGTACDREVHVAQFFWGDDGRILVRSS